MLHTPISAVSRQSCLFICATKLYNSNSLPHEHFLEATDIDIEKHKDGLVFMEDVDATHEATVFKYSAFLKNETEQQHQIEHTVRLAEDTKAKEDRKTMEEESKAAEELRSIEESRRKFESEKAQLSSNINTFKRMTINVKDTLSDVSVVDRRREWQKVESEFSSLKSHLIQLVGIDPSQNVDDINNIFEQDAEKVFVDAQKKVLMELKVEPITSGGASNSAATVRKETVVLPSFEGDEKKSPYLKFPIWKKQWEIMIVDYDPNYRDVMLCRHLDDAARAKIVGYETDYEEASKRLNQFYGDPLKIVQCVMREVSSPCEVSEGDYQGLIDYSSVLEDNFNRLSAMGEGYQKEMSNSSAMASMLRKFPRVVGERWHDHLTQQTPEKKLNPFPVLIEWLKSRRPTWEGMAAVDVERSSESSFFGQGNFVNSKKRPCYRCGSEDHIRRSCPQNNSNDNRNNSFDRNRYNNHDNNSDNSGYHDNREPKPRRKPSVKKFWCALHKGEPSKRCFSDSCQELRHTEAQRRIQLLGENGDCFHCCGDHLGTDCPRKERVCGGSKDDRGCKKSHQVHELFCPEAKVFSIQHTHSMTVSKKGSGGVLLLIMQVRSARKGTRSSVFWDLGCTSNFVREDYAKRCGFKGTVENLRVTTLGGVVSEYVSVMAYKCSIVDVNGQIEYFKAYGMETITGSVTAIDHSKIKRLFPNLSDQNIKMLQRTSDVNILIGIGHPSWHPDRAEKAKGGGDLWIYRGKFGSCVGGRHPEIKEETCKSNSLFTSVQKNFHIAVQPLPSVSHELEFCPRRCEKYCEAPLDVDSVTNVPVVDVVKVSTSIPLIVNSGGIDCECTNNVPVSPSSEEHLSNISDVKSKESEMCYGIKASPLSDEDLFFKSQAIGTVVQPECGGCKCGKCPIPGMKYSFKEQQEYDVIQRNLFYNEEEKRWYIEYPWLTVRSALPRNDNAALQLLYSLERLLRKKPELCGAYCQQIRAMIERGAAIELSEEQLKSWEGDYYYLPLLGVLRKNELRVVFDATRKQCGHPSMNECLMKGPDRFMNDLGSVLLGFRNGRVAAVADIRKFHNQVHLVEKDIHMQRFLWRNMETDERPKTYAVAVNNFGVKAANCIATSALHKSADCFSEVYPFESQYIKDQTYVDDELVAAPNMNELHTIMSRMDEICNHASMPNKGWTVSGEQGASGVSIGEEVGEKVLGMSYCPSTDSFKFHVTLKLKTTDQHEIVVTIPQELKTFCDHLVLTRRTLLANVARIFDPLGLLTALLLQSKILMRESWCGKDVSWDDPLPPEQQKQWLDFLLSLLALSDVSFARSLWPQEEADGLPTLVIFSDGSVQAFGAAAYIHWKLKSGGYWSRLIMAKSRIAPKNIVSVPRMELNGAVIGNRMKNFILKETNLKFSNVYQFVDSSTVLGYVQKECGTFKPYEGVRIAEIQSSNTFVDGALVGWAWVASQDNPADWCTKPRSVDDIKSSFWIEGPEFLKHDVASWPMKVSYKKENFEGQLQVPRSVKCLFVQAHHSDFLERLVHRSSSWTKSIRLLAWILRFADYFCLHPSTPLDATEVHRSKTVLIKFAQRELVSELQRAVDTGKGKFRKLAPLEDKEGVWRVGSRMRVVPFTLDAQLPALIPTHHRITLLIMHKAHQHSHSAQDGTTARFRAMGFWTVRCGHLAKSVYEKCVTCRKLNHKTLNQQMGEIPEDRLQEPVAWGSCQMDLFGPINCRGDVNPRTSKKTWGIVIEDVNSGAVHLDVVQNYSAQAVILSLRRFGALRGWPGVLSSDPGSQLESAGGKLEEWWTTIGNSLLTFAGSKNFKWTISPADSPWRQGKAERRIAIVKRLIRASIGDSRITPIELQTILIEIANICNERPIGSAEPRADGTYALITPNQLLLGRSSNILPDDTEFVESLPMRMSERYRLVHHVTSQFWKRWSEEVSPSLVVRQKWHSKTRNLCVGDLVMISDATKLKAKYKLGTVDSVTVSRDGNVRSATIRYILIQKNPKGEDRIRVVRVTRSVQRLVLILPVEEQCDPLEVKDDELCSQIVKAGV